jgi:hypothetical protein
MLGDKLKKMKTRAIRAGFQHRVEEPRFFVRTIDREEADWVEGYRWEIQFLDQDGCSGYDLLLGDDDVAPTDIPYYLPTEVLAAARSMRSSGDYFSSDGISMPPF